MPSATKLAKDYHLLPLRLPAISKGGGGGGGGAPEATHTLFIRKHTPRIPSVHDARALYVSNLPADATEQHLRTLFTAVGGGLVESVVFDDGPIPPATPAAPAAAATDSKKRKRLVVEVVEELRTWDRPLHRSGSNAVVYFVDDASSTATLRAITKSRKTPAEWPAVGPALGLARYAQHHRLRFPQSAKLQESVDAFMAAFAEAEEEAKRAAARRRQEPDEDGFVTVVGRGRAVPQEAAKEALRKQEEKKAEVKGFYRFQVREEKKAKQLELLAKFEEDRKRVEERKKDRKFRPE
ncbi:ribosomal RNA-processing protein 7-domain-containing protein [Sphaerosporella brunnea]|uniref:Ribosomal RNA-processing protein 7-domain-containing protein n=1 Tax=Sphaerosporella brunnea TaxID=1250544 RepID=A0A5J5EUJ5_9PEZI|nr:ribosomal RNA-processing protein 7-domain-containing protein [Sphaerosporella brunnea]